MSQMEFDAPFIKFYAKYHLRFAFDLLNDF
jgi:hypothetical protein